MKIRRLLALILAVALIATVMTSCKKKDPDLAVDGDGMLAPTFEGTPDGTIDFDAAYAAYKPGDVMMTAGGSDVTWDLLYYFLASAIDEVTYMTGSAPDLSIKDDTEAGTIGFRDQIISRALDGVLTYKTIEYGAQISNAAISDDDKASIALERQLAEDQYGGSDAFSAELKEYRMSDAVYLYLTTIGYLYDNAVAARYGERSALISDADVEEMYADADWLMAKHILLLTTDYMTPEEVVAVVDKGNDILAQLDAFEGEDFDAYFSSLMEEHGEDPGAVASPGGYLFTSGDMVPEFEQGTRDLEIGEFSGLIQTSYGYHIIYRLPIDFDAVPSSWQRQGYNYSLRTAVALEKFAADVEDWRIEMPVEYTDLYNNLDIAKVFK